MTDDVLATAQAYASFGWRPIPIPFRSKGPGPGWDRLRITPEDAHLYFNGAPSNIGIILGEPSGGLVDVDLDCPEAIELAPTFLLPTPAKFGRASKPLSHWLYIAHGAETRQFRDPGDKGGMLVELRSTGGQTVFPGSVHTSGETIEGLDGLPVTVDATSILHCVSALAAATLLARYFPARGHRHAGMLALAGGMYKQGYKQEQIEEFIGAVCLAGRSEDPSHHVKNVKSTVEKIIAGDPAVTGWKQLPEYLYGDAAKKVAKTAQKWLSFVRPNPAAIAYAAGATIVTLGADLFRVVDETCAALPADPDLYQRNGELARVVRVAAAESTGERLAVGTPTIRGVPSATLTERLTRWVAFQTFNADGDAKIVMPPESVVQAVAARGQWTGIRPIRGIVETPSLRPDGTLLDAPGYDSMTGYVYAPSRAYPAIEGDPDLDDARAAWDTLLTPWAEFPFTGVGAAVAVAALVTLVCRPGIAGAVPGFVFDASTQGSGKTLVCEALTAMATGRPAALVTWPGNDEELEKILGAYAHRGANVVVWDNIASAFGGPPLDKVLTCASRVEFRILGRTEVPALAWNAVTLANGNNMAYGVDTTRRILVGRLEPDTEKPEERTGYAISDLMAWSVEHHVDMVTAALTLVRAFVIAGKPGIERLAGWGSFETWRDLIAGAILWAGGIDVMQCRPTLQGEDNSDQAVLRLLIAGLPAGGMTAKEIITAIQNVMLANTNPSVAALAEAIECMSVTRGGELLTPKKLTASLDRLRGKIVAGKKLTRIQDTRIETFVWAMK